MQYTTNFSFRKPQLLEPASIQDLNANADSIDTVLYQNRHLSATDYNQNASYDVGDIVIYENYLYKCTGATSGNWDSSKWTRTTLAAEVENASQSGGSDVEGNPSGAATAQLEKLRVDNDIFFINDASKVIADPYDSTSTYAVGDYCIYGTLLYKCITAVSTAEAFDSTKWTTCLVTDEIGSGGGSVSDMTGATASTPGTHGLVPAPAAGDNTKFLRGDGTWATAGGGGGTNYSTTEQSTGLQWLDGSTIYKKTLQQSNIRIQANSRFTLNHGITNIGKMIDFEACMQTSESSYAGGVVVTPVYSIWCDNTQINLAFNAEWDARATRVWYFTLYYTKASS